MGSISILVSANVHQEGYTYSVLVTFDEASVLLESSLLAFLVFISSLVAALRELRHKHFNMYKPQVAFETLKLRIQMQIV